MEGRVVRLGIEGGFVAMLEKGKGVSASRERGREGERGRLWIVLLLRFERGGKGIGVVKRFDRTDSHGIDRGRRW